VAAADRAKKAAVHLSRRRKKNPVVRTRKTKKTGLAALPELNVEL